METQDNRLYLKKSVLIYKIYGGLIIYLFIATSLLRGRSYSDFLNLLVGLPVFGLFILPPVGLYYSWKSYRQKEGSSTTRFLYFLGHAFFCFITFVMLAIFIRDISQLF
jgi:hypothetical protein